MELAFLTPEAAAVGALAALPLAALAVATRRAARVRAALGLLPPRRAAWALPLAALVAVAALVALAAAQPVLSSVYERSVRTDAEAFFVLDTSRSMLAAPGPRDPSRLLRAKRIAVRLREAIPTVPAGIASLTDRALPHLFPTADRATFASALEGAIAVDSPPPVDLAQRITTYDPLALLAQGNFFSPEARRRLVVVLTDGEAVESSVSTLRRELPREDGYRLVFVQVWNGDDRIFAGDREETEYAPDGDSAGELARLARALGAQAFAEAEAGEAADALRGAAGSGPSVVRVDDEARVALAPYAVGAAFAPLLFLLWSRNRT